MHFDMNIVFTLHAESRLIKRKLLRDDVINTVRLPDQITKKYGKYYYIKRLNQGKIEVVAQKSQNILYIITVYWV